MSVAVNTLRLHIDYSAWASSRLVEAAAQLSGEELDRDFGTADKSVLGTLVHAFGADRVWLRRVRREPWGGFLTDRDRSLAVLQDEWPNVYDGWRQWLEQLTDATAGDAIGYRDMKGNEHSSKAWEIVLHVVNHATHHRGQVSGFLRALGRSPAPLDLVAFYRTLR